MWGGDYFIISVAIIWVFYTYLYFCSFILKNKSSKDKS